MVAAPAPAGRRLRLAALIAAAWLVVSLFFFSQDLSRKLVWGDPTPSWKYLVSWGVAAAVLGAMTPLVLWVSRRYPIARAVWPRRVLLHAVLSLVFGAVVLVVLAAIHTAIGFLAGLETRDFEGTVEMIALIASHNHIVVYWSIISIVHAYRYYQRYHEREREAARLELQAAELRTELVQSQLGALKSQLQPHFLFNTLNAIMVLVRQQRTAEAEETLARLSDLLRSVLEDTGAQEVPLHRELEHVKLYLAIEQLRFQDRLTIAVDVEPGVLGAAIPHLSLQPLVENAVRHGISRSTSAGRIELRAARREDALEVTVTDDGPGLGAGPRGDSSGRASGVAGRAGIGLVNTRARLERMFGGAASLTLAERAPRGVVATLRVPFRFADGADGPPPCAR